MGPASAQAVAGQRLLEHGDQRAVPREGNAVMLTFRADVLRCSVQANQRLPGSRHSRHEADSLAAALESIADGLVNRCRDSCQVGSPASLREISATACPR